MDRQFFFAFTASVLGLWAFYPYLKDVFFKKTHPHLFTWFIWGITQGTATVILWQAGGGRGAIYLTLGTLCILLVLVLSLFHGNRNITGSDWLLFIIALLAIGIWQFLEDPLLATVMVSGIDMWGYIPTFRKSYMHPWTETLISWMGFTLANGFSILALEKYAPLTLMYLFSILIMNLVFVTFLVMRRWQLARLTKAH